MVIKILGGGCANCKRLYANAEQAANELGIDVTMEKVEDYPTIMKYGVMTTPALVVDEQLKVAGRVLTVEQIKEILQK